MERFNYETNEKQINSKIATLTKKYSNLYTSIARYHTKVYLFCAP